MGDALFKCQLHQFLCWGTHVLKPLSERHDCETHAFKVLHHLYSTPTVKGNLTDVETFTEPFDKSLNVSVMDNITLGSFQISLLLPKIIRHMIAPDSKFDVVLRYPEVRENDVLVILILRWEHQNKCRNIRGGRQVQSTIADTPFEVIFVYGKGTFVPEMHRHPADGLFDPLI